jgi:hypothetical protein
VRRACDEGSAKGRQCGSVPLVVNKTKNLRRAPIVPALTVDFSKLASNIVKGSRACCHRFNGVDDFVEYIRLWNVIA